MIGLPIAHIGHALPMLPFFAPPLALTLGGIVVIVRDRLRSGRASHPHRKTLPR